VLTGKDLRAADPLPNYPSPTSSPAWTVHPGGHSEPADGQDVGGGTGDDQQVEDLVVAKTASHTEAGV
jgi:hypothetical protein